MDDEHIDKVLEYAERKAGQYHLASAWGSEAGYLIERLVNIIKELRKDES